MMTTPAPAPLVLQCQILQVETGLQQLMGDHGLYRQILLRFRQRYPNSAEQARTSLLAGDSTSARLIVHTLKGAAGMIGAQQVYLLTLALEPLFAGPPTHCIGPLAQLEQALRGLMNAIDVELSASAAQATDCASAAAPVTGEQRPAIGMLVRHLARLLEEGDGAAIDVLERSASALAAGLGVEVFQQVTEAAHQFDFETALEVLQTANRDFANQD